MAMRGSSDAFRASQKAYLLNLREKDRAIYHSDRKWENSDIALLKLDTKAHPHWSLIRVVIFPNKEGIICTVHFAKLDDNEVIVNESHLISLDLCSELSHSNLYASSAV